MKKTLLFILTLAASGILAQTDAEGSKDHAMLSRMPGFYIYDYTSNFNSHTFPDKPVDQRQGKNLEGNLTKIEYRFNSESGKKFPSCLQVLRNYSNAITKLGGSKVAENAAVGDEMWYCGMIKKEGKEIWVHAGDFINDNNGNGDEGMGYTLYVMEIGQMEQEVTATDILDALKKDGFIALSINFETGKSTIKSESMPVVDQIATMLKSNPDIKVSIEGHTDNVGDPSQNKKLSEQRAKAVMDAIVSKGIPASRLSSAGWGQEKPVADNRTEAGKAKNRRVEIVKK